MPAQPTTPHLDRPTASARGRRPRPEALPPWGWLEWVVLAQTAFPALMFIPGTTRIRVVTRVASFALSLLAWGSVVLLGRPRVGRRFPAAPWLAACAAWLVVSILHPTTNSLVSGTAQAALDIAVLAPAFWVGTADVSPGRLKRLMGLLFACNVASVLLGLGQFYRPEVFNPPVVPILQLKPDIESSLSIQTADGRTVLRPCGLTDTPGGASTGGALVALVGLCWALRPSAAWKRLAAFGLAVAGVAVIYLSQVRAHMVMLGVCLGVMIALFARRGDYRRAALLLAGSAAAFGLGLLWVLRHGGAAVVERFLSLIHERPDQLYYNNRGIFLRATLQEEIWKYPLGAGLGRWGMTNAYFGDQTPSADRYSLWSEIQWTSWIYDGGIPLLVAYTVAIALAIAAAARVARRSADPEVGFWAVPICALGLSTLALCFSGHPFVSGAGVQFWALLAALYAADQRAQRERGRLLGRG